MDGTITEARTMAFTTLVLAQAVQLLQRPIRPRQRLPPPVLNPLLWMAIGVSLALQVTVVYIPFLNDAFDTTAIGATDWLLCAGLASFVLWADELRKLAARSRRNAVERSSPDIRQERLRANDRRSRRSEIETEL